MSWTKPTSYNDIVEAIITDIKASNVFPKGANVEMSPGTLTEAWISKAKIPNAGAAFVAVGRLLSVKRRSDGMREHLLSMGVFAAAPHGNRLNQAKSLNNTVFRLSELIEDNRFSLVKASKPSDFSGRNLFSMSLLNKGSGLWALEWKQSFHLFDQDGNQTGDVVSRKLGRQTEWPTDPELTTVPETGA